MKSSPGYVLKSRGTESWVPDVKAFWSSGYGFKKIAGES